MRTGPIDLEYVDDDGYNLRWRVAGSMVRLTPGQVFAIAAQLMQTIYMHDRQAYYELRRVDATSNGKVESSHDEQHR